MTETLIKITVRGRADDRDRLQVVELDGVRVGLRFRWSALESVWYLWIHDVDGSVISGPRALVPGLDLMLGAKHDPRVPPGQLFVYSPDRSAPTLETIDVSAIVFYRKV